MSAPAPARVLTFDQTTRRPDSRLEWLVTNGLGGYACGTVGGGITRRYHGLLNAALPAPLGRTHYVSHVRARVWIGDRVWLIDHEDISRLHEADVAPLLSFALEAGLPVWRYRTGTATLEKRVLMPHGANTTLVRYRLEEAPAPSRLEITPLFQVRPHDSQAAMVGDDEMVLDASGATWRLTPGAVVPPLQWTIHGDDAHADFSAPLHAPVDYAIERERGYAHGGTLWSPGTITATLREARGVDLVFSTRDLRAQPGLDVDGIHDAERERRTSLVEQVKASRAPIVRELALAADAFLIVPVGRQQDLVDAHQAGDRVRTVIAGYHWFTDWGRDTMIGLEGLTLCTGRHDEAAAILQMFARHVRDGLIPNLFPEGEEAGLYHTADATLWFIHAIHRYVSRTGDHHLLDDLLPTVEDIIEHHLRGTHFGIHVDPNDGLLSQGAAHYQLTWMDAKAGDWVVTPRRGKAVEINALWYNALRLAERWLDERHRSGIAARYRLAADRAYDAFNARFWNPRTLHLFDVVDGEQGDDDACRPNQVFAIALPHPVLARDHWASVLAIVRDQLLTPVGLRSLAPGHPALDPIRWTV